MTRANPLRIGPLNLVEWLMPETRLDGSLPQIPPSQSLNSETSRKWRRNVRPADKALIRAMRPPATRSRMEHLPRGGRANLGREPEYTVYLPVERG